jgi:2-amino-4-hydroxy-6-hydroxymethyldihydropteridine diphosphokinase
VDRKNEDNVSHFIAEASSIMHEISRLVLITLGSNQNSVWGDAKVTIQKAMLEIAQLAHKPAQFSNLYATPAFPAGAGSDFVNAAMAIYTNLSATQILAHLHRIEAEAGRERKIRWGQRTLDLDLIAVDAQILPDRVTQTRWRELDLSAQQSTTPDTLILPHPRVQDRSFALIPLNDVAPDWRHPILDQTIATLCAALPAADRATVVPLGAPEL